MSILSNLSITDWRRSKLAPLEQAGIAFGGGRMPMVALDAVTKTWRTAGRSVANPWVNGRFDLNALDGGDLGLVVETASANMVFPSTPTLTGWSVNGGASISAGAGAGFAGILGVVVSSGTSDWGRAFGNAMTVTAGTSYTISVWLAAGSSGKARIELFGTGIDAIVSGTVGALAVSYQSGATLSNLVQTDLGGAWCIRFRVTPSVSASNVTLGVGPFSSVNGKTVSVFAAQMEALEKATGYIPTTTAAQSRSVDNPYLALGPWFSSAAGSLRFTVKPFAIAPQTFATFVDASETPVASVGLAANGAVTFTAPGFSLNSSVTLTSGIAQPIQIAWGDKGGKVLVGGTTVTGAALSLSSVAKIKLGPANGVIQSLFLWDRQVL